MTIGRLLGQSSDLCQGAYYTEEQGAAKLKAVQYGLKTLVDWKNHADSIRTQLRKGMGLEILQLHSILSQEKNKFSMVILLRPFHLKAFLDFL
jgi:hypothetical protein